MLADEPTGALDSTNARGVLALLRESVDALGQTVVMVTHDPIAAAYADQVVFLVDGRVAGRMNRPTADAVAAPAHAPRRAGHGRGGVMTGLALRSLRFRATAFTATFLSILLGTALIGSFATLVETSRGTMSDVDRETLIIMGAVVGGWGTMIVLFSLASTLGIAVRQRGVEIALLRTVGGTPRQARRMVRVETLVVAVLASGAGRRRCVVRRAGTVRRHPRGWPGRRLRGLLRGARLPGSDRARRGAHEPRVRHHRRPAGDVGPGDPRAGRQPVGRPGGCRWWRVTFALLLIGYGVVMAVVTVAVMADSDDPYAAMQTSGSSSILVGLGLATLAPVLLRWFATALRPLVGRFGAAGQLAAFNTSRRSHLLAGVLAPVIVFTAAATGTLMLVGIDGRTLAASTPDSDTITLLNNVVVGMISLFAAIMVVNAFAAVIAHRRAELARLRLLGATREQVRSSVLAEAGLVAAVGVVLGLVAAMATIVPFAIARDEGPVPDGQLWLPIVLAGAAAAITLASAAAAVRRATSVPPLAVTGVAQ